MSARGFGSVLWAGTVASAALGFYLVSLNVASERAELENVENRIALAQRDIRLLQTEIGTRGRLAQLERWNVKFIRLSAPAADQFVDGGFQLATLAAPKRKPAIEAPVVLASATADQSVVQRPQMTSDAPDPTNAPGSASDMMHVASYALPKPAAPKPSAVKPQMFRPEVRKPTSIRPAIAAPVADKSQKPVPAMKPTKSATADPLAPLSAAKAKAKGNAPAAAAAGTNPKHALKDSDPD
jgi:hypothetical protein